MSQATVSHPAHPAGTGPSGSGALESFRYDDAIVRKFALVTIIWGVVGMLVGVIIAAQLAYWPLNLGEYLSFGRLRPLHTNAVIFAFGGNAVFCGMYYSIQRVLKTRLWNDTLSNLHFWGWQGIIVAAAITLPLGFTQGKEYAELEWPIDLAITVVWVIMAINFFMTLWVRREKHMYVAVWFFMATIITVAILHLVNSMAIPVQAFKSYSVFAGVQDAMIQWWYGHNAVAFFLTTPFLGLMYYFMPKAAQRPVYSYKLSILHFWSLVFIYIWAGPHHLHYTSLPDWASTLGMTFSLMLWAPSWGGMVNGLLTLRGAWHKVTSDVVLKFFVVGCTFYGMSTFEGPLLSIKSVNSLSHYTDWTIGHVHSGALGWNGFITFGVLYYLVPRLWKTPLYSQKLANAHFWIGTIGIVMYVVSMWTAGITQGLMWRAFDASGRLEYPEFIETLVQIMPFYWIRLIGGTLFLVGMIIMGYNVLKTVLAAPSVLEDELAHAPARVDADEANSGLHRTLEGWPMRFAILTAISVLVATAFEFVPAFLIRSNVPTIATVKPYTPLELEGRDLYVMEGCYTCHSQMVRPLRAEVERYGEYSKPGEFVYDHPFQWGSKRTGPDLHRVGGKYPDMWHVKHMEDPRVIAQGSIMPAYKHMFENKLDFSGTQAKVEAMAAIGVPYSKADMDNAQALAQAQAKKMADALAAEGRPGLEDKQIIAMIAYLQRLGSDIEWRKNAAASTGN